MNNDKIIYIQSIIVTQPLPNFDFCEIRYNLSSRYRLILQKIQMDSGVKELEFIIHGLVKVEGFGHEPKTSHF